MQRKHGRNLRRGRSSVEGGVYVLTTVTHQRQPLFRDFWWARIVVNYLRDAQQQGLCRSLAWVVMPDHVHWLVESGSEPLHRIMQVFKSSSGVALRRAGVETRRVWQAGYHDRALRREEDVMQVARYIVANPIRAGIVPSARVYSHWDAIWV